MAGNFKKEDLRIVKTFRALFKAMNTLLDRRSFSHITVNDLCEEAQLSRTAFYTHFRDKYDLLQVWLRHLLPKIDLTDPYEELEKFVNGFIKTNSRIITNLIENCNNEVFELLHDFIINVIDTPSKSSMGKISAQRYRVLCSFCAGGVLDALHWQINSKFPAEHPLFNEDLYHAMVLLKSMENV